MTITLFITILTIGSILNILMTQSIKQWYKNQGKIAPPNMIALINSAVCGGGVTAVVYMLLSIPWTVNNIICLVCVIFFNWLSAMTSYDKVIQTVEQIGVALGQNITDPAGPNDLTGAAADDLKNKKN